MRYLRQNTAVVITVGPFFDKADGLTPLNAITTVANLVGAINYDDDDGTATHAIHFHPAASGSDNDMTAVGADGAGLWNLELTQANTNYVGRMILSLTDAAQVCPVFHEFSVLAANVYDWMFGTVAPVTTAAPTAAANATAVWQDTTAGDFTVASSIGKSLYTAGVVPGGTNGLFIAGTNAATTITTSLTTTFTGNLTGTVAKSPATLATADVTGNLPADVKAYTVLPTGMALDSTVAKSATALSNATWTDTKAGYIDAATTSRMATFTLPANFSALQISTSGVVSAGNWSTH